jgi:hypothetical protein
VRSRLLATLGYNRPSFSAGCGSGGDGVAGGDGVGGGGDGGDGGGDGGGGGGGHGGGASSTVRLRLLAENGHNRPFVSADSKRIISVSSCSSGSVRENILAAHGARCDTFKSSGNFARSTSSGSVRPPRLPRSAFQGEWCDFDTMVLSNPIHPPSASRPGQPARFYGLGGARHA